MKKEIRALYDFIDVRHDANGKTLGLDHYLVLSRLPKPLYHMEEVTETWQKDTVECCEVNNFLIGTDGPFVSSYKFTHLPNQKAFGGLRIALPMEGGGTKVISGDWWDSFPKDYGVGEVYIQTLAGLKESPVFLGAYIKKDLFEKFLVHTTKLRYSNANSVAKFFAQRVWKN